MIEGNVIVPEARASVLLDTQWMLGMVQAQFQFRVSAC